MTIDPNAPRIPLPRDWQPREGWQKCFKKKPREETPHTALRHISYQEEPYGTLLNHVRLQLNEELFEPEKTEFRARMRAEHPEWFSRACWGSNGHRLAVRITIKPNEHLADARMEVGKHADLILQEILAKRQEKK